MTLTRTLFFACAFLAALTGRAQEATAEPAEPAFTPLYKYRVYLADKKHSPYSLRHPEQFLSQKSIDRRKRQGLRLDKTDLPVSPQYLEEIGRTGVKVVNKSKWLNTVVVATTDTTLMAQVRALPCVKGTRLVAQYTAPQARYGDERMEMVYPAEPSVSEADTVAPSPAATNANVKRQTDFLLGMLEPYDFNPDSLQIAAEVFAKYMVLTDQKSKGAASPEARAAEAASPYGAGLVTMRLMNAQGLHDRGFRGQGMTIAVIDGGFLNVDAIPLFQNSRIVGTADLSEPGCGVYDLHESHGTMVLSCMAVNQPGQFIGTAPEAAYWLVRSEEGGTEQPVEEDNWCAAAEFADSIGADLINSSLGYQAFDNKADNIGYDEIDGRTHPSSYAASLLASKGIVACLSAGNSGTDAWHLITVPADADHTITVGAVDCDSVNAGFSSLGALTTPYVKPDLMSLGVNAPVVGPDGSITHAGGTSFASPNLCGLVACYWQAHPKLKAEEVLQAVRRLGDNYDTPNNVYGYGIPDFGK